MYTVFHTTQLLRYNWMLSIFFLFLFLCVPVFPVFGATSNFVLRTLVGSDTTPPTVPAPFTATPITATQIDLAWGASTDDLIFSGYHVWRDNTLIATTTLLTYSDTGLTPSTTYSYYVTAYDAFLNESASSSVATATTPSLPPVVSTSTPVASSKTGSRLKPLSEVITSMQILPERDAVVIRYETSNHIRSVLRWGRTSSFELGSLAAQAFNTRHETRITGLMPGTLYTFTIEGENKLGRYGTLRTGTFMTLQADDTFPPDNVSNLRAYKEGDDIVVSWKNPDDADLRSVRVMRNDQFFPGDSADGWLVYEGLGTQVRDVGGGASGEYQYYTVFTYDALGNISSGAVVRVYLGDSKIPEKNIIDPLQNRISLSFDAVVFTQEGIDLVHEESEIYIDGSKQLTIGIPYDRVPEHLKTILVVIGDSTDAEKSFTFLLRINKGKTAYQGTLAPFGVSGKFPVQVSLFDYKTAQIGYANGLLVSEIQAIRIGEEVMGTQTGFLGSIVALVQSYVFWMILLLILLMYLGRRLLERDI